VNDDDGLRCAEMSITTNAHLRERGIAYRFSFLVLVVREDGERIEIACPTFEGLVQMVETMHPPAIELHCARDENREALLDMVRGWRAPPMLH
jgi:hypothetical protein